MPLALVQDSEHFFGLDLKLPDPEQTVSCCWGCWGCWGCCWGCWGCWGAGVPGRRGWSPAHEPAALLACASRGAACQRPPAAEPMLRPSCCCAPSAQVHSLAHKLKFILEHVMVAAFGKRLHRTGSGGLVSVRRACAMQRVRVWGCGVDAWVRLRAAAARLVHGGAE